MNRFLIKLFKVLFVGLIIAIILDFSISKTLLKSTYFAHGESYIWSEIKKGRIKQDLLIYGSSRAMTNFNSQIIEDSLNISTYNLGFDGHNFWLQYLRHKKLLEHNPKPKIILLSVGIFSLNKRKDLYNHYQFLPFLYDYDMYAFTSSYEGFSLLDYTLPLYRYSGKQDSITKVFHDMLREKKRAPYRHKGFRGMKREWNNDLEQAKLEKGSIISQNDTLSVDLFQKFLKECQTLNIKVVFVYSPEQVEGQQFVNNRNQIISTYQFYAKKYDIPFLDYSNNYISSNKNYFYNSLHLNAKGADVFTLRLVSDLKQLDLQ
ncbi:hypothetical protein NA63_1687 [Flavobacteriaceae bacterium MAR_2010_105]|nr:hypothetical protein NA63_1687 [Flavobacteriaceae bacterium MAR_2010_105]